MKKYDPEYIVVYDTETNGLDEKQNEILEICAKKYRRLNRECVETLYFLCAPESGYIDPVVTKINGIDMAKVEGKPSFFKEASQKFYDMCKGNVIVGHNIIGFDNKFTRIDPSHQYDTMVEYRKKFPGKRSKLGLCCKELKIKFSEDDAHSAEYDVDRTADLYWALTGDGDIKISALEPVQITMTSSIDGITSLTVPADNIAPSASNISAPASNITPSAGNIVTPEPDGDPVVAQTPVQEAMQAQDVEAVVQQKYSRINLAIDDIRNAVTAMAFSFSKLQAFQTCPFKWYKDYVEKYKFPEKTYFAVGRTCHTVAERSAVWCFTEAFARRFEIAVKSERVKAPQAWIDSLKEKVRIEYQDFSLVYLGRWLYDHPQEIMLGMGMKLSQLVLACADAMDPEDMDNTAVYSPDDVTYEQIVNKAIIENKVLDDKVINDVRWICRMFKKTYSFDTGGKAIILSEKKVAFDSNWKSVDWFSNTAQWRGVIDYIEYHDTHVVIRDYKSSRKIKTVAELQKDMQLKSYVANVVKLLPTTRKMPIRVEMIYMRTGDVVGFDIEDVELMISEVDEWIDNSRSEIYGELKKPVSDMFMPIRNEFCDTCDYCVESLCPLFTKREQSTIAEPSSFLVNTDDTCVMAWKQAEANKAEAKTLETKVKAYLKVRDGVKVDVETEKDNVKVDRLADLAVFCDPKKEYDTPGMAKYLLSSAAKAGVDSGTALMRIFKELTMSATAVDKLCAEFKTKTEDVPADLWKTKYTNTLACRVPGESEE